MTLAKLLVAAHIPRYQQARWFSHARYVNDQLVMSDADDAAVVTRCYLESLRQVAPVSGVTVVTAQPEPAKPVSAFKKTAWHGERPPKPTTGALW